MTPEFDKFIQSLLESEEYEGETVSIRGEYWFDESGDAVYADGDIGDMNHEMHVIQRCAAEVASNLGIDMDEYINLSQIETDIIDALTEEAMERNPELDEREANYEISNDPANALIKYVMQNMQMDEKSANDLVLTGWGSVRDAREYAINNWGWSGVHGDSIETKRLDRESLKRIASGISNALQEEGTYYEYEDTPEAIDNHEYKISTYTGKRYRIALKDMESGNVSGLEEDVVVPKSAATQQVRDMDMAQTPSFYQQKGVIGDSVKYTRRKM